MKAFTEICMTGSFIKNQTLIKGWYDDIVERHQQDNEWEIVESPFYGWELNPEILGAFVTVDILEGLSIHLYPKVKKAERHLDRLVYEYGGQYILATLHDVGGRPDYDEFMKVIKYLLNPLKGKIGWINQAEVKAYCGKGRGYIMVSEDRNPRKPLLGLMQEIGLAVPDNNRYF